MLTHKTGGTLGQTLRAEERELGKLGKFMLRLGVEGVKLLNVRGKFEI